MGFLGGLADILGSIINWLLSTLGNLIYFVVKWMLLIVDVLFSYVQELCGLNMDLSSLETAISKESDFVFNLLLSSQEVTVQIVRSLIGIAIALIIIFSIAAVIRTQYKSTKENKVPNITGVLKNSFKAIILLIVTPLISIVGIIASDVVLQSLYNASNVGASTSLSSTIFGVSSSSANSYRIYAQNGLRIPITCDFTREEEFLEYYQNRPVTDKFSEYMQSYDSAIFTTLVAFNTNDFISYDSINNILYNGSDTVTELYDNYYTIYDINNEDYVSSRINQYKKIESYAEEYYVMADVVDYFVQTSTPYYYKTIQDVLDSIYNLPNTVTDDYKKRLMNNLVDLYHIEFLDSTLTPISYSYDEILAMYGAEESWTKDNHVRQVIRYTSNYYSTSDSGEPDIPMQIQYNHLINESDEFEGAKYIIAVEEEFTLDGITYTYFTPLVNGYSVNNINEFRSEHIANGQLISAKGIFNNSMYPTAIKKNEDGSQVQFYRDNIENIAVGEASNIFSVSMQQPDGFLSGVLVFIQALFDPESLIPDIKFNPEAIEAMAQKETVIINVAEAGKIRIGYMMDNGGGLLSSINQFLTGSVYGLNISNLFYPEKLNFLILVLATTILLKVCFSAIFALISRGYELMLIIIIYPTACATIPLSDTGYSTWMKTYISRLLSTYGIILGINFVFILFPVIQNIEFFTQDDVGASLIVRRVGALFFSAFSVSEVTKMMNMVVVILFELVAFTLIQTIPGFITEITASPDGSRSEVLQNIGTTIKKIGKVMALPITGPTKVLKVAGGAIKAATHPAETAKNIGKKIVPGSKMIEEAQNKFYLMKKKKAQSDAYKDLKNTLKRSSTESGGTSTEEKKKEVMEKLEKFQKAQNTYTEALSTDNLSKMRKSEPKKKKNEEKDKTKSARFNEDGEDNDSSSNKQTKTNHELKKQRRENKKEIKELKKQKIKVGPLKVLPPEVKAQIKELKNENKEIKKEIDTRKKDTKGLGKAKRNVEKYKNIVDSGGTLTEKQQKKYDESLAKVDVYETRNAEIKEAQEKKKERKKQAKVDAKREKIEKEDRDLFRNTSWLARQRQKTRLQELDAGLDEIETEMQNTGYTGKLLKSMSISELINLRNVTGGNDLSNDAEELQKQKEIIDKYIEIKKYENELISYTTREYEAKRNQEVRRADEKDQKYARRRPSYMVKTGRHVNIDETELNNINSRITELEQNMTTDDFEEYRKLVKKREELMAQKEKAEQWAETKQKSHKELRQEKRNKKLQEDAEVYGYAAYKSRPEEQKDLTLEDFVEGYKNTQENKKRKRRKNKEKEE